MGVALAEFGRYFIRMELGIILLAGVIAVVALFVAFKVLKAVVRSAVMLAIVGGVAFLAYVYRAPLLELISPFIQ